MHHVSAWSSSYSFSMFMFVFCSGNESNRKSINLITFSSKRDERIQQQTTNDKFSLVTKNKEFFLLSLSSFKFLFSLLVLQSNQNKFLNLFLSSVFNEGIRLPTKEDPCLLNEGIFAAPKGNSLYITVRILLDDGRCKKCAEEKY